MKRIKSASVNGLTEGEAALLLCILGTELSQKEKYEVDAKHFEATGCHLTAEQMASMRGYPDPDDAISFFKSSSGRKLKVTAEFHES